VVRPRSCRVIYYFDTPALGRRHQSFDRVNYDLWLSIENRPYKPTITENGVTIPKAMSEYMMKMVLHYPLHDKC